MLVAISALFLFKAQASHAWTRRNRFERSQGRKPYRDRRRLRASSRLRSSRLCLAYRLRRPPVVIEIFWVNTAATNEGGCVGRFRGTALEWRFRDVAIRSVARLAFFY